ncbi:MAG: hypothetical protein ACRDJK_07965, partial [Actinomycetota bacterium]
VYLFRVSEERVLYVGKAKSLRHRVPSYFGAGVHPRTVDVRGGEFFPELGAEVLKMSAEEALEVFRPIPASQIGCGQVRKVLIIPSGVPNSKARLPPAPSQLSRRVLKSSGGAASFVLNIASLMHRQSLVES